MHSLHLYRRVLFNLTGAPSIPLDFEEATWQKLSAAVRAVHATAGVSFSEEELYQVHHNTYSLHYETSCMRCVAMPLLATMLHTVGRSASVAVGCSMNFPCTCYQQFPVSIEIPSYAYLFAAACFKFCS